MASDAAAAADRGRRAAIKALKAAGFVFAVFVLLLLAVALFVSSRWFGAIVEAKVAEVMRAENQRALRFNGPLAFVFWPDIGFQVGRVTFSEAGSEQEFAALDHARIAVRVLPLLAGKVALDACEVDGLRLNLVKRRDGSLNIADLMPDDKPSSRPLPFDIAAIRITSPALTWSDEAAGSRTTITDLRLTSGHIKGDPAAKDLRIEGAALDGAVGSARMHLGVDRLEASAVAANATGLTVGVDTGNGENGVSATLSGRLAADLDKGSGALEDLSGSIAITHPRLPAKSIKLPFEGGMRGTRTSAEGKLAAHFDQSDLAFQFRIARFSPLALNFTLDIDRLDLDRYLGPDRGNGEQDKGSGAALDLSGLDDIELDGIARVGTLEIGDVKASNLKFQIRAAHGKLDVGSRGGK